MHMPHILVMRKSQSFAKCGHYAHSLKARSLTGYM